MNPQSLELLDQIIEVAAQQDEEWKLIHKRLHKSSQTVGEGFVLYHLKLLKELLLKEQQNTVSLPVIAGKTYSVALGGNGWTGDPNHHPGIPCTVIYQNYASTGEPIDYPLRGLPVVGGDFTHTLTRTFPMDGGGECLEEANIVPDGPST